MKNKRKIVALLIIIAMLGAIIPLKVYADVNDAPDNTANSNPTENHNSFFSVTFRTPEDGERGSVKFSVDNGTTWVELNSNTSNIPLNTNGGDVLLKIVPQNNSSIDWSGICLIIDSNQYNLNEASNGSIVGAIMGEQGYKITADASNIRLENVEFRVEEREGSSFNGTAWFVWNDNGSLCKCKIEDIPEVMQVDPHDDFAVLYDTKYVKAKDIKDGEHTLDLSKMHTDDEQGENYFWVKDDKISEIEDLTKWSELESYIRALDYDELRDFAYDPCGAKDGKTSISTNGDRSFRATVYNEEEYFGLTNATTINDVKYYPEFWNPMFFNPIMDIYGSTFENPAVLETYIEEPFIRLASDDISGKIDKIEVASDINKDAVEIKQNNRDNSYEVTFKSNYYDQVIFKITSGNNIYYLRISRISLMASDDGACLLLPEEDEEEYLVIATYILKDGTEISAILESQAGDYGGKNLQLRDYFLSESDRAKVNSRKNSTNPPVKAYYTVIRADSTSTQYKGTFSGSGKGVTYNVDKYGRYSRVYNKN